LEFGAEVIFPSTSGVLSPGPLFFTNLIYGSKQGVGAGIKLANGHTIIELPLLIILGIGLSKFWSLYLTSNENLKVIGLIGGVSITLFSLIQLSSILNRRKVIAPTRTNGSGSKKYILKINSKRNGPLILGIVFTAANPFFLIWWSTIGLKLISDSIFLFGTILGIVFVFFFHIWMDYAWLSITSFIISKGTLILQTRFYNVLLLILSVLLTLYGLYIIVLNIA
jgi:threonine/homoserine/homoserine lactone efflux protein